MVNLDNYPAVTTGFDSENFCGYTQRTTFWDDFTIAEMFGEEGIKDTYNRCFKHWKHDTVFITELCMILNWKCNYMYQIGKLTLCGIYEDLFYKLQNWCDDNLKGDDLNYYLTTTD